MSTTPSEAPPAPPNSEGATFLRRTRMAAYILLLLVLSIHLLEKFRDVLQPFFIAMFLTFMMHPIHRWLVRKGIPSLLAYIVIVALVMLGVLAVGLLIYTNLSQLADRDKLLKYEDRLDAMIRGGAERLPFKTPELQKHFLREIHVSSEDITAATQAIARRFGDFTTWAVTTFLFILFVIAEKVSFPRRMALAFGAHQGMRILGVVETINLAIGQYVAVKTLVSALAGLLSYAVLAVFEVEFAATWGILIFLLNYIPYLGSLVAVALPIVLSFLQFDEVWKGAVIAALLVGVQQGIGAYLEPRIAGQRLDVSPLLILLALAFWGAIWGIVGMILAVPLLVIVRIILDNIPETRPIATLMSNR
jgi:predicted PurR-regulated permease PerM